MDKVFQDIFAMPLFPHLYAIPISIILGMALGYFLRGKLEGGEQYKPQKPKV